MSMRGGLGGMLLYLFATPVLAGNPLLPDWREEPTVFTLAVSDERLDLAETRVDLMRISAELVEIGASWLHGVLQLGYLSADQRGWAPAEDRPMDGGFAGAGLRLVSPERYRLRMGLAMQYAYHLVREDSQEDSEMELTWHQAQVHALVSLRVSDRLSFYGGGGGFWLKGEEELGGTVVAVRQYPRERRSGTLGGLELRYDEGGYVGFEVEGGGQERAQIYFQRRY